MNIQPIKNKKNYEDALTRIEELMDAKKGTPESDELVVLAVLVEEYEKKHFSIEAPDPIEVLKFYMEQNEITRKDLEDVIGSKGHVSDVLNKIRPLSLPMIRAISRKFSIPIEILTKEYPIKSRTYQVKRHRHRVTAEAC